MRVEIQGTKGGQHNSKTLALVKIHTINNDSNANVVVDSYVGYGDGHNKYRERDIECISVTNRNGDTIEVLGMDKLYDLIQKANHTIVGTRYLSVEEGKQLQISDFPNFCVTGSIEGMKKLYYGEDALLVVCGDFIYNVSSNPTIYYEHAKQSNESKL